MSVWRHKKLKIENIKLVAQFCPSLSLSFLLELALSLAPTTWLAAVKLVADKQFDKFGKYLCAARKVLIIPHEIYILPVMPVS